MSRPFSALLGKAPLSARGARLKMLRRCVLMRSRGFSPVLPQKNALNVVPAEIVSLYALLLCGKGVGAAEGMGKSDQVQKAICYHTEDIHRPHTAAKCQHGRKSNSVQLPAPSKSLTSHNHIPISPPVGTHLCRVLTPPDIRFPISYNQKVRNYGQIEIPPAARPRCRSPR